MLGGWQWETYKETLFVGEPIIFIRKFKNTDNKVVKVTDFRAGYLRNRFSLIFKGDTFKYFPGYYAKLRPLRDTLIIIRGDSVYTTSMLFWKDFGGKARKPPPFPKTGESCKILINNTDLISLYFIELTYEDKEGFEILGSYHFAMPHEEKSKIKLQLQNLSPKNDYLSPYLNYIQIKWLGLDLTMKLKILNEMKIRFPKHILTEMAEISLMWRMYGDGDPKNEKTAKEMRINLLNKYPSNLAIRKALKLSWKNKDVEKEIKKKGIKRKIRHIFFKVRKSLRILIRNVIHHINRLLRQLNINK